MLLGVLHCGAVSPAAHNEKFQFWHISPETAVAVRREAGRPSNQGRLLKNALHFCVSDP